MEQDTLQTIEEHSFSIPEPVYLQLREIGVITSPKKEHLYPTFLPLLSKIIGNQGGYYKEPFQPYDDKDDSLHNLYDKITCLCVVSKAGFF